MKYHNIPTLFDNQASLINGKNIGTDSVRYIQDAGQKTAGTTYIDKNTNELYVCVTTTNSVNNDSNFSKFNLKEAFNKLDSWSDIKIIGNQTCIKFSNGIMIIIAYSDFLGSANPSENNILNLCHPYRDSDFLIIPIHLSSDGGSWQVMCMPMDRQRVLFQTFELSNGIVPIITFGFWF